MLKGSTIYRIGLLVACLTVLTACRAPAPPQKGGTAADPGVLRVGVSTDAPPLIYRQGEEVVGLEAEMAREFAGYLGKRLQFVEIPWSDQIPALLENRSDIIMAGMSVTEARGLRIAFCDPYFRTGQMALVRREDQSRLSTGFYGIFGQAPVMKFGVVKGTTGENYVRKEFGGAQKIVAYETAGAGIDALLTPFLVNRIDILIHDGPILLMLTAERDNSDLALLPTLLTEEYLAWGVRKNDPQLLKAANQFLAKLKREGRLNDIIRRWVPFTK